MSAEVKNFRRTRARSTPRLSIVVACGAASNALMLTLLSSIAQAAAPYTWTSSTSGNWTDGTKWQGGSAPVPSSTGDDNIEFNASGSYTSNNDMGPFFVYNTTFDSGNGTTNVTGGDLNLSWPLSEANNPTFTNNSTNPVTISNNLNFEAPAGVGGTVEYFSLVPGSTTTFNGTVNLTGGSGFKMVNGQTSGTGGPGGTLIWTQPVTFTNSPATAFGSYFPFRIYEGTFEMGGYTIYNGTSNSPVANVSGVNVLQSNGLNGVNNGAVNNNTQTDMYLGPEDVENGHPNDVVAFYLIADGNSMNQPVQIGDAGSTTIGGVNTSGTVIYNDFFKTLPTDGNGTINGVSQTVFYSAAAGGTVLQNFQLIRGGGSGFCGASVDKIGPGTWIVAGGGDNDTGEQAYHGNTTVRDGTLELQYDDTGINSVALPQPALDAGFPFYGSGLDGGSLGFNDPSNAVQLGDSGTLTTDNIALLTLNNPGLAGPRQVLHNISVNNNNSSGTTTVGVADNGTGNFLGTIFLNKSVVLTGGAGGLAKFGGSITGSGGVKVNGTGTVLLIASNSYGGGTTIAGGALDVAANAKLGTAPSTPANNITLNGGTLKTGTELTGISLSNAGSGYLTFPTVTINSGADNVPAVITTVGNITGLNATNAGAGYTAAPTITVTGGGGTGLTAETTIDATTGAITSVKVDSPGTGYTSTPTFTLSGGTPTTAGIIGLNGLTLTGLQLSQPGFDYSSPTVSVTGGGGTGATATATSSPTSWSLDPNRSITIGPSGGVLLQTAGSILTYGGTISGTGSGVLTKSGTGTLILTGTNSWDGGTAIASGLLLAGNGFASVGAGNIAVNGGSAILRNTTTTSVFNKIKTGVNSGTFNGPGINSASAAADTRHLTTIGMLQPASATTFGGQSLGTGDVAIKYTYYGDADLSGTVNGADYQQIDNGFGSHLTGWQNGDFNYDGVINGSDFALIDNTFNQITATGAGPLAIIASPPGITAVPEPTTIGLLGIGAFTMLSRRRSRNV